MNYEQLTTYYLQLAERMLDEAFGEDRHDWIERVEAELPKIRDTLSWLSKQKDGTRGLELTYRLQEMWFEEKYTQEGLALIQRFLAMPANGEALALRARSLDLAGALAIGLDRLELARSLKDEGLELLKQLGDQSQLGYALLHLGHLVGYAQGDYVEARRLYNKALTIFQDLGDSAGIAHATSNLASVGLELEDYTTVHGQVKDSLQRYTELDSQWDLALTLGTAAGVAVAQGSYAQAVRLAGASAAHRERIGVSLPSVYKRRFAKIEQAALNGLGADERSSVWEEGRKMTLPTAVRYALAGLGSR